jgi:hypothetical protein
VHVVAARRQTWRIGKSLEHTFDERRDVARRGSAELRVPFVDRLTDDLGQRDAVLAQPPRLGEALAVQPHVHEAGVHT